jgi:hypothetical protein
MILFLQWPDATRQFWKIEDVEDLNPVFAMFPMAQEVAMSCETLKEAVAAVSEYLSGHALTAWVEDTDISKSLRNKAVAVGLALSTALNPSGHTMPHPSDKPTMPAQVQAPEDHSEDFGTHPADRFLWNVEQIESTGGKNTKHKPIMSGKFKGTRAMGKWGLLKPTVDELVGRMQREGTMKPEYAALQSMSRDKMAEHLQKNPKIELGLARKLAEHVLGRQKGDYHKAAFAWLHGHNMHPVDISHDQILHSDYVSKFKQLDKLNPYAQKRVPAGIKKAQYQIDSSDFKMRVKNWYKRREDELTEEPTHDSTWVPDMGRIREEELDAIKPESMMTPEEKLKSRIKEANKRV